MEPAVVDEAAAVHGLQYAARAYVAHRGREHQVCLRSRFHDDDREAQPAGGGAHGGLTHAPRGCAIGGRDVIRGDGAWA